MDLDLLQVGVESKEHFDYPVGRELHGVLDQVHEDLLEASDVAIELPRHLLVVLDLTELC